MRLISCIELKLFVVAESALGTLVVVLKLEGDLAVFLVEVETG